MTELQSPEELTNANGLYLFSAEWCMPCKQLTPLIDKISGYENFSDISFTKINVDNFQDVSVSMGIRNVPTMMFIRNGEIVDKLVGAQSEEKIVEKINSIFYETPTEAGE